MKGAPGLRDMHLPTDFVKQGKAKIRRHHDMETLSTLVTFGEEKHRPFSLQKIKMRSFDVS